MGLLSSLALLESGGDVRGGLFFTLHFCKRQSFCFFVFVFFKRLKSFFQHVR